MYNAVVEVVTISDNVGHNERPMLNDGNGPCELDSATCGLESVTSHEVSRSHQGHGTNNNVSNSERVVSPVNKLTPSSEQPNATTPATASARGER